MKCKRKFYSSTHFTNHLSRFTKKIKIMNTELLGVIGIFILTIVLAIPLGKYIAKVFLGDKTLLDPIFNPLEKFIFKISGINPAEEMNWKQHLKALLSINMVWFFLCFFILLFFHKPPTILYLPTGSIYRT